MVLQIVVCHYLYNHINRFLYISISDQQINGSKNSSQRSEMYLNLLYREEKHKTSFILPPVLFQYKY